MATSARDRGKCNLVPGSPVGGKMRGPGKVAGKVASGRCREAGVIVMGTEVWV